jgi:anti-sigma B factor antagonist
MSFFQISAETASGGVHVLVVSGSIDFDAAPRLKSSIRSRLDEGGRHMVIDLSEADFIDSTAIGVLVATLKRLREEGGSLAVVCERANVRNIFEIVGLDDVIPLHRSRDDALRALAQPA